jgi:pimeloyl-ACP methyl ester carboxylesterase
MPRDSQQIRFCRSRDGTRIAYATCGEGPPLVRAGLTFSHLELEWDCLAWRHWLELFARGRTLVRYDMRGTGLSDRDCEEFSFDRFQEDFAAVIAGSSKVVDVGGGEGTMLLAILAAHDRTVGLLFEQPHVVEKAGRRIAQSPHAGRCTALAGNALESIPGGADTYLMSRVIHDWDDERALVLLRNCRSAMAPGARLVLVERVLPERIEASLANQLLAASDLQMMIMNGGRERTEREFRALMGTGGFRFVRRLETGTSVQVLEGEAW